MIYEYLTCGQTLLITLLLSPVVLEGLFEICLSLCVCLSVCIEDISQTQVHYFETLREMNA